MECKRIISLDCHSQGAVNWGRNEFTHWPMILMRWRYSQMWYAASNATQQSTSNFKEVIQKHVDRLAKLVDRNFIKFSNSESKVLYWNSLDQVLTSQNAALWERSWGISVKSKWNICVPSWQRWGNYVLGYIRVLREFSILLYLVHVRLYSRIRSQFTLSSTRKTLIHWNKAGEGYQYEERTGVHDTWEGEINFLALRRGISTAISLLPSVTSKRAE